MLRTRSIDWRNDTLMMSRRLTAHVGVARQRHTL